MSEQATFGGGCFWCVEAIYQQIRGIESVVSGYAGGTTEHPSYEQMHAQDTGHAEVIQVTFDPTVITYRELLEIFYAVHDPTTPNRQGNDVGAEYRSIILWKGEEQQKTAEDVTKTFAPTLWDKPIVTELAPLTAFWPAEAYHQNYYAKNQSTGYCQVIINPKLAKFRKQFAAKLK